MDNTKKNGAMSTSSDRRLSTSWREHVTTIQGDVFAGAEAFLRR